MSKYNPMSEERKHEIKMNIKKELKALIFPLILFALFAFFVVFIMTYQVKTDEINIVPVRAYAGDDKMIVMENDSLKFEMDPLLTSFDITVKKTGKVWHSTATDGANDPAAISDIKNKLQSTMLVTYGNEAGLNATYDSYSLSALNGIYEITADGNSVRVDYSIGKVAKEFVIPPVIEATRLDELLATMDKTDSSFVKDSYKLVDINNLKKSDNKEELLENFPKLAEEPLYIQREIKKDTQKKSLQTLFEEAGYTYEEYLEDKALSNLEETNDKPIYNISVIYTLDGDDLLVTVPFSEIDYPSNQPMMNFTPLPYFGAGSIEDEGFILLPEGGGSIIDFNNGKVSQSAYYANMYGWDMAIERADMVHTTHANANVFGISHGSDSFICILEKGSSYAAIEADISGRNSSYNHVDANFTVAAREKYSIQGSNSDVYVYLENIPAEDVVLRYDFVNSGDYVAMAKAYQDYLVKTYPDTMIKNTDSSTPVAVEIIGAVDKVKQIMGVPVSRPLALTTYKEAAELITQIQNDGISNLSVKYTGWCNGGVKQKYGKSIHTVATLGSKKDLTNLTAKANDAGVDLYLDSISAYEFKSNIFHGFFSFRDAAKFLSRKRAELYEYSAITYTAREGLDSYFLLHGQKTIDVLNNFAKYTSGINANLSLQDIGDELSSDFQRKAYVSREAQLNMQVESLKNINASGQKIMINNGNSYATPYADFVTKMDLKGNEYTIIDRTVPFYQIAIHGYKNYAGLPVNLSGNQEEEVLYAAEYGAGLMFTLMKESSFTLQKTLYTKYYASDFDKWESEMVDIYTRYNNELGHTFSQFITGHEYLAENVTVTSYEDGTKVYVNYGFYDYKADGKVIPARDYLVVR